MLSNPEIVQHVVFNWHVHAACQLKNANCGPRGVFHEFRFEKSCRTIVLNPEMMQKIVSNIHFFDPFMEKCKMLVSVDIANWDARLGTIKFFHTGFPRNTSVRKLVDERVSYSLIYREQRIFWCHGRLVCTCCSGGRVCGLYWWTVWRS